VKPTISYFFFTKEPKDDAKYIILPCIRR